MALTVPLTQAGWPVIAKNSPKLYRWVIPAHNGRFTLLMRNGSAGFCLAHLALSLSELVEDATQSTVVDDWGWAYRSVRDSSDWSNHAGGIAFDFNALQHVLGKAGTWSKAEVAKIETRLDWMDNIIRWGGDYMRRKDEMHFELVCGMREAEKLAKRLMKTPRGKRILLANPGQAKVIMS